MKTALGCAVLLLMGVAVVVGASVYFDGGGSSVTWSWNGQAWRKAATSGPPGGADGVVFFDVQAHAVRYVSRSFEEWEWLGYGWREVPTADRPPIDEEMSSLGQDPLSGDLVAVMRAVGAVGSAHTWLLSGGHWRKAEPSPALDGLLVPSVEEHRLLLFGGEPSSDERVWQWMEGRWMQLPSGPKGAAADPRLPYTGTYDPVGRRYVVQVYSDIEQFRDGQWTRLTASGTDQPCGGAEACAGVIYSPAVHAVLLFEPGAWWRLDGNTWTRQSISDGPQVTYAHTAYDAGSHQIILFGGCDHGSIDTTVCFGPG